MCYNKMLKINMIFFSLLTEQLNKLKKSNLAYQFTKSKDTN